MYRNVLYTHTDVLQCIARAGFEPFLPLPLESRVSRVRLADVYTCALTLRVSVLTLRQFRRKALSPPFAEHSAGRHSQRGEVFDRCSCTDPFSGTAARHHAHTADGRSRLCSSRPSETAASLDCHCNSWCWAGVTYCRRALCAGAWADLRASCASPETLCGMCSRRPHDDLCRADELGRSTLVCVFQ